MIGSSGTLEDFGNDPPEAGLFGRPDFISNELRMYLHVEHKRVPANRQTESIERLARLHQLMAASPGFQDAQICAYLGNPSRYLVTRTWQDALAHAAYRASAAAKEFAQNRPAVLPWENTAVQEWETILISDGQSSGDYLVRTLYSAREGSRQDFLDARERHDSLRSGDSGLAYSRGYRPLDSESEKDGPSEVLLLERYTDRLSYTKYLESPERAEYERATQPYLSQPELVECYEVLVETRAV